MEAINRLTTQFVDLEDRIQVTGATAMGRAVTLWLPQRLLNRVVPALCRRLDPSEGKDVRAEVKNTFAQQVAVQALTPQPVVKSQPGAGDFTIRSISIKTEPKVTQIIFDESIKQDGGRFAVTFNDQALRQWLSILHSQYIKAEWSLHPWPEWVAAAKQANPGSAVVVH